MRTAAILMGGEARRFGGADKSRLLVGGRSIFDRQLDELSTIADDILLIGSRPLDPANRAAADRCRAAVRVVPDRVAGCGPMAGLDAALAASRSEALVVVACDMPFVTAGLLDYLRAFTAYADAVVPRTKRGHHPVCAAYTRACQPILEMSLAAGRLSMTDWLTRVRLRSVEAVEVDAFGPHTTLLANINTSADLGELTCAQ
jgi:molybdopterin-guanine dinucleotide biosynthesis protein A